MIEDEPLFALASEPLRVGDKVTVQTIWGDETGLVLGLVTGAPYPMARVLLDVSSDEISINIARVVRAS